MAKNPSLSGSLRGGASVRALIIMLSSPLAVTVPLSCAYAGGVLPTGGQYVAGSGSIGKTGATGLTINQSSSTGIINWKSFSVEAGNTVQFNNGSGATLNRVTGGDLSTIAGSLKGTGSVYLINPQGVIVTGTGRVLTGGTFVGSTRDETDDDFRKGKRHFTGTSNGNVANQGQIVSSNGDVALIGNSVSNSGAVSAKNGSVSLNAGNDILLAPAGSDGHVMVSGGKGDATNSGSITAAQARLNAADGNVYALSGNNGGVIRATGTSTIGGHVWLTSGTGGVGVAGTVAATNADGSGGTIEATGNSLAINAGANISASGTKGGTILLGGDVHGGAIAADNFAKDKLATAQTTTVAKGAMISADASNGIGGNVVVWSDGNTDFEGTISAKGASGKSGGFAEVSSHDLLNFTGTADLTAGQGPTGTLLLDPYNVYIANDPNLTVSQGPGVIAPTANTSFISVSTLETALASANVKVSTGAAGSQAGDIAIIDPITWSGNTLTLDAYHSIIFGATASATNGAGLTLKTNDGGTGGDLYFEGGNVTFGTTSEVLTINGTIYTLANSIASLDNDISTIPLGKFALANNYDASADGTYTGAPIVILNSQTLEGLGNTISNLSIDIDNSSAVGMIEVNAGTIRDLTLSNPSVIGGQNNVSAGALVGENEGSLAGDVVTGGRVAVYDAASPGAVVAGGLVGASISGTINRSSASTAVTGGGLAEVGGLVGSVNGNVTVENSSASGNVSGGTNSDVGGLVGQSHSGTIETSYATGTVTVMGTGSNAGGLVGNQGTGVIETSYATGAITAYGSGIIGGLVGDNAGGTITNAYALGAVTGASGSSAGGFVGYNETGNTISDSYSAGAVSSTGTVTGGFAGMNGGTLTNAYYATSSGPISGIGTGIGTAGGLSAAQMLNKSSFTGFTFGTTPGAAGWVIVDNDGSFNSTTGTGETFPMLESEASAIGAAHIITNAHQLELANLDLSGSYFVGNNVDASATGTGLDVWGAAGFVPIGGDVDFSGTMFGLGHPIDGLYVNSSANYDGMIGYISGWVEGTSVTNADIVGANEFMGALAGYNHGTMVGDYSSGTVSGGSAGGSLGGLVGRNDGVLTSSSSGANVTMNVSGSVGGLAGFEGSAGSLTDSFATGNVNSTNSGTNAGGLAGASSGPITASFATGDVTGTGWDGGLVGFNYGEIASSFAAGPVSGGTAGGLVGGNNTGATIAQSYATGVVTSASGSFGGLIGYEYQSGDTTNSYWDAQTSGVTAGAGNLTNDSGVTGETTAALQAAIPSGFNSATWGVVTGASFPYLKWLSPNGAPQVVSGTINGGTTDVGLQVGGFANTGGAGDALVTYSSGVDGSYNVLFAPGSLVPGGTVTTFINDAVNQGYKVYEDPTGSLTGVDLNAGFYGFNTDDATLSAALPGFTATFGGNHPVIPITEPLTLEIDARAATFDIDTEIGNGSLAINSAGTVTQEDGQTDYINAQSLLLEGSGEFTLQNGDNRFTTIAGVGTAAIFVSTSNSLTVGTVGGVTGIHADYVELDTDGADANIAIDAPITASGFIILETLGTVTQSNAGILTTDELDVDSNGATTLNAANVVTDLGNSNVDSLSLTDAASLTIDSAVNAGTGAVALTTTGTGHALAIDSALTGGAVSLTSANTITQNNTGVITATTLTGSSAGGTALTGANLIGKLEAFTNTGGGNIAVTNAQALYVSGGNVNAGTGNVTLAATGSGHALNIGSSVITGTTVSLASAGTVNETGAIHATTLLGSSVGGATLNGANLVGAFDSFSNTSGGNIALTDAQTLYVGGGGVNAGTGNVTLTTAGAGHNVSLGNVVTGTTVNLFSAGTVLEGGSGAIHATTLLGSSVGGATLNDANLVGAFDSFTNTGGGNVALTDAQTLYIGGGGINAGTGNVTLTTTGAGHALSLGNIVTGTTVNLLSAGTMLEGGSGSVHATTLQGSSVGGATLNDANLIGAFDSFTNTGGGNIALTDAQTLYVGGGGINAGTGNVTLTTTGAGHALSLGNVVTGTTVGLISAGTIGEGGSGAVHATTLLGSSAGGATLNDANLIGAFDSFSNTGGGNIALTNGQALYIGGGGVNAGTGNVALTTTGTGNNLSIGSALSGATVTLTTAGEILEGSAGSVTAATVLNVSAGTGIDLNSTHNHIHAVGTRHTTSGPNVIAGIGM